MANYFYLKSREGSSYEEHKGLLLDFIGQRGYTKICFLHDTLNKMSTHSYLGKALVKQWGQSTFDKFLKARTIAVNGRTYSFSTIKTLGFSIDAFDVIAHVYVSTDS